MSMPSAFILPTSRDIALPVLWAGGCIAGPGVSVLAAAPVCVAFAAGLRSPLLRGLPAAATAGLCHARAAVRAFCVTPDEEKSHA